jgi:hypothetical protein
MVLYLFLKPWILHHTLYMVSEISRKFKITYANVYDCGKIMMRAVNKLIIYGARITLTIYLSFIAKFTVCHFSHITMVR